MLMEIKEEVETILVDGGSRDGTLERLAEQGLQVHVRPASQRSARYNAGIEMARGDLILLIHPRSVVPRSGLLHLMALKRERMWGAFRHSFDWVHPLLKFTSWYSNFARGRGRGIYYLDHCLFFSADLKMHARFPDVEIFEDTLFCASLRRTAKPLLLPFSITTSAIRFRKNGVIRQCLLNQLMKILFYFGVSQQRMNRLYERGLSLNAP